MNSDMFPILVVDDEPFVLSSIKRELRAVAPVMTAGNAEEAYEIVRQHTTSVVISDYKMPGKDGVTFLSELDSLSYEPVKILLTAYGDFDVILDAVNRAGIYYFIRKPWESAELVVLVKRAIETFKNRNELDLYKGRLSDIDNIKKGITALLAHELKTPLTTISGYSELLNQYVRDEDEAQSVVRGLQSSVERLESFVNDVIQITKLQTGDFEDICKPVDLTSVLSSNFPNISIPESLTLNTNPDLLLNSLTRVASYMNKHGGVVCAKSDITGGYLFLKFYLSGKGHDRIQQLTLFQNIEPNTDLMHYGRESSMDIAYAFHGLKAIGVSLNIVQTKEEGLRVELIFKDVKES